MVYTAALPCESAAWRPTLTKDKSRWRKYFTTKQILKSGIFNNAFYGQDIVMEFSPPEYCSLFAQKKAYQGGVTGTPGPLRATPLGRGEERKEAWYKFIRFFLLLPKLISK